MQTWLHDQEPAPMHHWRRWLRLGIVLALILQMPFGAGCTSWKLQGNTQYLSGDVFMKQDRIRVTTRTGEQIVILEPQLHDDHISGVVRGKIVDRGLHKRFEPGEPIVIALAEVERVESQQPDVGRSVLAVLGGGVLVLLGVALYVGSTLPDSFL